MFKNTAPATVHCIVLKNRITAESDATAIDRMDGGIVNLLRCAEINLNSGVIVENVCTASDLYNDYCNIFS